MTTHSPPSARFRSGDIWYAPADGGTAVRLTSHPGLELFPKFSPDGRQVAFTGQYGGDEQVYTVSSTGGQPEQMTYYPARGPLPPRWGYDNQVYGWTPDGESVLFRSLRDGWDLSDSRLYTIDVDGVKLKFKKALIATGGRAAAPPIAAAPAAPAPAAAKPPAAAAPAPADPFAGLGGQSAPAGGGIGLSIPDGHSAAARYKEVKRSSVPLPAILLGGGSVAALIAVAVVVGIMWGGGGDGPNGSTATVSGKGELTLVWPESERTGAKIQVDGKEMDLPASGPVSYLVSAGQRRVVILRRGYEQVETHVLVPEKDKIEFAPEFKPAIAPGIEQFAGAGHLQGGFNPDANFDSWLQDLEQAKASAAQNHKDVLILFNESDTNAQCMEMARKVLFDTRFGARVASEYELVHIDFPSGAIAAGKVQNAPRNDSLRKEFGIDIFPTVLLTDAEGYPYAKLEFEGEDVFEFSEKVNDAKAIRQRRDDLARIAEEDDWERRKAATQEFLALMASQNLEWFYSKKYQQWFDEARQADPDNQLGHNEHFFQLIWMARVHANLRTKNDSGTRSAVGELDRWMENNQFRDENRGAMLHLLAAIAMAQLNDVEAVQRYARAGQQYSISNKNVAAGLSYYANADSFNVLGNGTGFVIAEGYVMTNHHVIEGDAKIAVRIPGLKEPAPAKVIAQNEKNDLALLKVDHEAMKDIPPVPISLATPGRGIKIAVFGYPLSDALGNELKLTTGVITATGSSQANGMLILGATVNPGNSGGPLCNTAGEVIGIVTAKSIQRNASEDTYGMAVPADRIVAFLRQHLEGYQAPPMPSEEFAEEAPEQWSKIDREISGSVLQVLQLQE